MGVSTGGLIYSGPVLAGGTVYFSSDFIIYLMNWTAKSTGRNFRMPAIEVLTFRDAKIAKLEFNPQDAKAMADSLEPMSTDG